MPWIASCAREDGSAARQKRQAGRPRGMARGQGQDQWLSVCSPSSPSFVRLASVALFSLHAFSYVIAVALAVVFAPGATVRKTSQTVRPLAIGRARHHGRAACECVRTAGSSPVFRSDGRYVSRLPRGGRLHARVPPRLCQRVRQSGFAILGASSFRCVIFRARCVSVRPPPPISRPPG